ncbi:type II 3-dehydroquinate dehydratase [Chlamydiota bacterium]
MKILVINGPNLNLLGKRETAIYGTECLDAIEKEMQEGAQKRALSIAFFQSNHEGAIIDKMSVAKKELFDLIIINPAAYTHTSVAIRDVIAAIEIPVIEVHLSNIYTREEFRHHSLIAPVCVGQISGFGKDSYLLALEAAYLYLQKKQDS